MLKAILKNIETGRNCVTTSQASEQSGLSKVYLAMLVRERTLEGFQLSRDWFIYTDSLEQFLLLDRKSGPRGPRKKKPASSGKKAQKPQMRESQAANANE